MYVELDQLWASRAGLSICDGFVWNGYFGLAFKEVFAGGKNIEWQAVRRIKNSPLTSEEIARIEMGLKKFKLDWISIWRFLVPYRDPSLLPRQWRIAFGTQKSYKSDAKKKAKRRLYESKRRASKPPVSIQHSSSEKEV
ncbi:unnamed protein product [Fraxinus pennsylvanica]|uniref:Uncharacterized protein n=1 Tax=Fraxinus pennsylvanica TaxID=56036 RepID=A0AAD2DN20_9LAMI|nr:unnamed protein product [Fraxinus pennsylvanica]